MSNWHSWKGFCINQGQIDSCKGNAEKWNKSNWPIFANLVELTSWWEIQPGDNNLFDLL